MVQPTWIPFLGLSAAAGFSFIVGNVVFSICAPIVVVESINPAIRTRRWLSPVGLGIAATDRRLLTPRGSRRVPVR
jgi:hypothetical protein